MNKKIKIILVSGIALSSFMVLPFVNQSQQSAFATSPEVESYYVDFYNNYLRQEFTLSSGYKGKGNSLLYTTIQVQPYQNVPKPQDPERKNYEFQGWFKEAECEKEWNFGIDTVTKNTKLYAKWGLASKEEIVEPEYTPPSTILEGGDKDYIIDSIMNFKINEDQVKVTTAAITKLEDNASDVLPLMEYRVKPGKNISATYENKKITVNCGENEQIITVKDDSINYRLDNSTYETKAAKYEAKALDEESYHVMLAGSSSIEFWESSKEDLDPIVSYNHGIGGTTIEEWDEKLNQRLVYPYKPKMVVYYVGINNVINSKQDATTISNNLIKFFNDTHEALPHTQLQYILMNLIPNYSGYFQIIRTVNAAAKSYQANNSSWLTLINPGDALLKENGEPNAAYFRTDGLHLSYYGYVIWGGIIKESILAGLEAM